VALPVIGALASGIRAASIVVTQARLPQKAPVVKRALGAHLQGEKWRELLAVVVIIPETGAVRGS